MINVCPGQAQADCHLLEFPDGTKVLIDAGEGVDAPHHIILPRLLQKGIRHIALVVISHFHKDHYGRLREIIEGGVKIDRVAINVPAHGTLVDGEHFPGGFDRADVDETLRFLRDRHITVFTPKAGDRLIEDRVAPGRIAALDVICLYDGLHTPVGDTDTNDTSIILRLSDGTNRALFTGDLNWKLGTWLAASHFDLSADILKAPHHGTEGAAPDIFFDRVNPRATLVPASKSLWLSIRSKRIRTYFSTHRIPVFVSGIDGDVTVTMTGGGYKIETEKGAR